jgi:competence protein ComEC
VFTPVVALGTLAGVSWVQLQSSLGSASTFFAWAAAPAAILLISQWAASRRACATVLMRRISEGLRLLAGLVMVAFAMAGLATWVAHGRIAERLSSSLDREVFLLEVIIRDLPTRHDRSWRFEVDVQRASPIEGVSSDRSVAEVPSRGVVTWFDSRDHPAPSDLKPGQRWQFVARLRVPVGSLNPGGFDYEAWMLENRLFFTASVQLGSRVPRPFYLGEDTSFRSRIDLLRDAIRRKIDQALPEHPSRQVLSALVVGDQRAISAADWAVFQRTGVAHLMSISGLHVTMFAALAGLIGGVIWRWCCRWPLTLGVWVPVQSAAAMSAIIGAFGYALLAGFAVPAQRTAWMVAVFGLARILGLRTRHWSVLSLALLVIVVPDPMAVLAPGFWLSFLAVGFLFALGEQGRTPSDTSNPSGLQRIWATLRAAGFAQVAITFGLLPITAYLFQQIVLVSLPSNAVAIPLVSYLVTPLAMVGTVEAFFLSSTLALTLAAAIQSWLFDWLVWISQRPFAVLDWPSPGLWPTVLAAAGMVLVFGRFPIPLRYRRLRHLGWSGLLFLWSGFPAAVAPGEMRLTMIDVGQGSSVLIRTRAHTLLYDAGPSFGAGDAGARFVLPTLRRFAVNRLDRLVLSHLDQDHSGGAPTLIALSMVDAIQSPDPNAAMSALRDKGATSFPRMLTCLAGDHWTWDGVQFQVLHPTVLSGDGNTDSCVLRVEDAFGNSLLLTGDITPKVERSIVGSFTRLFDPEDPASTHLSGARLASQLVTAPHHGNRHALTEAFLRAVAPTSVLVQSGFRNQFGHPHPETLSRIQDTLGDQVKVLRTDLQGAIDLSWHEGRLVTRDFWQDHRRYWHLPR